MVIAAIIIGITILGFIVFLAVVKEDLGFEEGMFAGICLSILFAIEIGIISSIISKPTPTVMDVYQDKTTLEYIIRDDIKIDSVVVFKEN